MDKHHTHQLYSKIFLIGEYAACQHGRGIVFCFPPVFEMSFHTAPNTNDPIFSKLQLKYPCLQSLNCHIHSPHRHGGFGQSSAVFRAVHQHLCDHQIIPTSNLKTDYMWYLQHAWDGNGLTPSGLDFLSQPFPGCHLIDRDQSQIITTHCLQETFGILICHMKQKVATHTHLKTIDPSFNSQVLDEYTQNAMNALTHRNTSTFLSALEAFQNEIRSHDLEHPQTTAFLSQITPHPLIQHARGCGALGADVVLILTKPAHCNAVYQELSKHEAIQHIYKPFHNEH